MRVFIENFSVKSISALQVGVFSLADSHKEKQTFKQNVCFTIA